MSVEQNKKTLQKMYEEVWNKGNMALVSELASPDYRFGDYRGPEGWGVIVTGIRSAFPDLKYTVDQVVGEGDTLAYRITGEGTNTGKYGDLEPTGKKLKWTQMLFSQFKDGRLVGTVAMSDGMSRPQMMEEHNKEVTRRTLDEVINQGNTAVIPELFSPDYVHCSPDGQEIRGHDGWKNVVTMMLAAFPDAKYKIEELVCEGDKVTCRYSMSATHKGEYNGIPATGKRVTNSGVFINRFENSKVAETFGVSNPLLMYRQLGVAPPEPAVT